MAPLFLSSLFLSFSLAEQPRWRVWLFFPPSLPNLLLHSGRLSPEGTRCTPGALSEGTLSTNRMSKRRLSRADEQWHYEGDHADEKADVEEWEAQADGTFTKLLKSASVANIDQLVKLKLDRGELMDEDQDEDEVDEDEDPDDAGVDAGVQEQEQEQEGEGGAEGEVGHTEEEHGSAAAATDAKEERPCKRPKVDEDEL